VEALLRKYLWAIDLGVIALCAVFLARAASSAVESSIVVPPMQAAYHAPRAQPVVPISKDVLPILKRNVFCSTCPPWEEKTETGRDQDAPPSRRRRPACRWR
jgi:hypothetical protein